MQAREYNDELIIALRRKYAQKQYEEKVVGKEILIDSKRILLRKQYLFGKEFSMMFPENWTEMKMIDAVLGHRGFNETMQIKTEKNGDATIVFQKIVESDEIWNQMDVVKKLKTLRQNMEKIWIQNVFYDEETMCLGEIKIPWIDMKAFCLSGSFYCLIFLFPYNMGTMMGNFYCSFERYNIWKPIILKLLMTMQFLGRAVDKK